MSRSNATDRLRGTTQCAPLPGAILIPAACRVLQDLKVSASLFLEGQWGAYWAVIQQCPNVQTSELEHDAWGARQTYNERCLARMRRHGASVVGQHAGFSDLFVPIRIGDRVPAAIVSGPFATARPTSAEILERWRRLTGRHGHPSDPEFALYLSLTLSTLTLDQRQVSALIRLLERMADLISKRQSVVNAHDAEKALGAELLQARFVERMWEAARILVDERTGRSWTRPEFREQRQALGLTGVPDHVVVGLFVNRRRESDPVDGLLRGEAFQRACVELARDRGNVLSGQIGEHGVTFLGANAGSGGRARRRLIELSEEAARLASRQFGLQLSLGASAFSAPLPVQYRAALAAAEAALSAGSSLVYAETEFRSTSSLGALCQELARQIDQNPKQLPARFDRFLELVATRSGHRLELANVYLESAFDRMSEAVLESGALDAKGLQSVRQSLERASGKARTLTELFAAYRRVAQDLALGVEQPTAAHTDRSLRRAEEYVREHYSEPLTLTRVARVAGFAPSYFSRLFHQRQKRTFVDYLTSLRIARAKELLTGTSLNLQRIAELSGFSRSQYLSHLFRKWTSFTPMAYRRSTRSGKLRRSRPRPASKIS